MMFECGSPAGKHYHYIENTPYVDFALARYNSDGTFDTSFGDNGVVITDFGRDDEGYSVALQADGKIVVAGTSALDVALARFNTDGSIDTSFGSPSLNYVINGLPVVFDNDIQIYDPYFSTNSYQYSSLTLSRHGFPDNGDVFSGAGIIAGQTTGNVIISNQVIGSYQYTDGVIEINFNSMASQSLVDRALESIAYSYTGDTPIASVQIDWLFSDINPAIQ